MNHPRTQRLLAFTLIEVLIVITIIAIVVAMLLPAVKLVREVANETVCKSGLRQIYAGIQGYKEDFNGVVVPTGLDPIDAGAMYSATHPFRWGDTANGPFYGIWWHWLIYDYVAKERAEFDRTMAAWQATGFSASFRYKEGGVTWSCPSAKRKGYTNSSGNTSVGWPGFGKNLYPDFTLDAPMTIHPSANPRRETDSIYHAYVFHYGTSTDPVLWQKYRDDRLLAGYMVFKFARIQKAASRIMIGDADNAVLYYDIRTNRSEITIANALNPSRHRARANNYLYFDGRVARQVINTAINNNNLRLGLIGRGD